MQKFINITYSITFDIEINFKKSKFSFHLFRFADYNLTLSKAKQNIYKTTEKKRDEKLEITSL